MRADSPTSTSEQVFGVDYDYDAESLLGILTTIVTEYPDAPLSQVWAMVDWEAVRRFGEGSLDYHARMDERRERLEHQS